MLAESVPWTFCQNNTVMLTYSHNHAPGILLWQSCCHRNEKQNSKSFFNYDANLTSVITMELKFIFFALRCWFLRMTSTHVTSSTLKTFVKFWGFSFKLWLRPCRWWLWFWNLNIRRNLDALKVKSNPEFLFFSSFCLRSLHIYTSLENFKEFITPITIGIIYLSYFVSCWPNSSESGLMQQDYTDKLLA